jgi:hypothetical protein
MLQQSLLLSENAIKNKETHKRHKYYLAFFKISRLTFCHNLYGKHTKIIVLNLDV